MIDRAVRDGYEVHRAALAHGLDVVLLPRQVMEVKAPDGSVTAFTHGVPQQTTLAAATYAQDVRMRRDMVMRGGYMVPTGATFSMGGSRQAPYRYAAEKLGYPVVVKPAVGDNTVDVISGIKDHDELLEAIEYFQTPPTERPGYTRAAYALTELREPGVIDGRIVVPPSYRYLIEQQVSGEYLRFLVLDGRVLNVVLCPEGPWRSEPGDIRIVTDEVHASLTEIAVGVAAAIPGIALAAVDLVVKDRKANTSVEDAVVVEYSERPWLAVQQYASDLLAQEAAEEILRFGVQADLPEPSNRVTVHFTIEGSVHPEKLLNALLAEFAEHGLVGDAELEDAAVGTLTGKATGSAAAVALIMESMIGEGIRGQRAMLVDEHVVRAGADENYSDD